MKKVLLLFFCALCTMANAQKIVVDKVSPDGIRTIMGETVVVRSFTDKVVFKVGLCASILNEKKSYSIIVESTSPTAYIIKKGMKLLLKDKNKNDVTLEADGDFDASVGDVHNINGFVTSDYTTSAFYTVSEDIITQLSEGVLKIGQEHTTGRFDKEYKKDKIGAVLKQEYSLIKNAIATQPNNDF